MPRRTGMQQRVQRWRDTYWRRTEAARTDTDRLMAAVDLLRAASKHSDPKHSKQIVADATKATAQHAENLLTRLEKGRP